MDTILVGHSPKAVLMLGQFLRRWPSIKPTLGECTMFARKAPLSMCWVSCFEIPAAIQSVVFQTQHPAKNIGGMTCYDFAPHAALGMKCIYYYYGIPTGNIAFWGTHVQFTIPFTIPLSQYRILIRCWLDVRAASLTMGQHPETRFSFKSDLN